MIKIRKSLVSSVVALTCFNLNAVESYDVIDLGTINDNSVYAYGLNNARTAVGYSFNSATGVDVINHGFAYQNGAMTDLGAIDNETTDLSIIFGINNNDLAVGLSLETITKQDSSGTEITADFEQAIYVNITSGELNQVPNFIPDDAQIMRALSVNDSGLIVGFGRFNPDDDVDNNGNATETFLDRGFVYDSVGDTLTRIDPINYDGQILNSSLRDVNDAGMIVGWSQTLFGDNGRTTKSVVWNASDLSNPVQLPLSNEDRGDFPWAINDNGKVVGKRNIDEAFFFNAYVYDTVTETVTDIPELREGLRPQAADISIAYDVNNQDQVVGTIVVDVVPNTYHAFIYENSQITDLNTLIDCKVDPGEEAVGSPDWVLYEARAINEEGVILGNGLLNNQRKAFLLIPRPGVPANTCTDFSSDSGSGNLFWLFPLLFGGLLARIRASK